MKHPIHFLTTLLLLALPAACIPVETAVPAATESPDASPGASADVKADAANKSMADSYPREVEHFTGITLIEERPTRVYDISLYGTWVMQSFGETPIQYQMHGERIPQFAELIELKDADIDMVDNGTQPDLEMIAAAAPDLIISQEIYSTEIRDELESIAPVVDIPGPGDGGWRENVRVIGDVFAMEEEAEKVIAESEAAIANSLADFDVPEDASFAFVFAGVFDGLVFVCQDPTYAPVELLLASGLTMTPEVANLEGDVCTGLSLEVITETLADTDILILFQDWGGDLEGLLETPVIATIPAIQEGRYYALEGPSVETISLDLYAPSLTNFLLPVLEEIGALYDSLDD